MLIYACRKQITGDVKMTRDYKKQYLWNKENKITFSVVLSRSTDADIVDFLEDKQKQRISRNALIKKALRDQMLAEGYKIIRKDEEEEGEGD